MIHDHLKVGRRLELRQSHSLFLPHAYDRAQRWPVVFGFSPLGLAFGDLDGNAWEMHGVEALMNEHGVMHWSDEFMGLHLWPSRENLAEALEPMEPDCLMPQDDASLTPALLSDPHLAVLRDDSELGAKFRKLVNEI